MTAAYLYPPSRGDCRRRRRFRSTLRKQSSIAPQTESRYARHGPLAAQHGAADAARRLVRVAALRRSGRRCGSESVSPPPPLAASTSSSSSSRGGPAAAGVAVAASTCAPRSDCEHVSPSSPQHRQAAARTTASDHRASRRVAAFAPSTPLAPRATSGSGCASRSRRRVRRLSARAIPQPAAPATPPAAAGYSGGSSSTRTADLSVYSAAYVDSPYRPSP